MPFIDIHTHKKTTESSVISIENKYPNATDFDQPFSIGIHPWFIKKERIAEELVLIENQLKNNYCFTLGECGLDTLSKVDFSLQKQVFREHILLSEKYQMPIIIHCVKAFQEVIAFRKELKPSQYWIIHGFNKNKQVADSLLKNGFLLSFGAALLHKETLQEVVSKTPIHQFFLETDNASVVIQEIYEKVAKIKNMKVINLQEQIQTTFNSVFKK